MTRIVQTLVYANIAAFIVQAVLPGFTSEFAFIPALVLLRPWTLVTYMFLHGGITHLLFNMLGLYFFGSGVETRLGSRRFLTLYVISGLSGALLSMVFSSGAAVIGASAGVFGVMLAFAMFWPDTPIYIWMLFPVPARVMVILTTIMSIWSGFGGVGGNVAHFAHLGGYAGAFLYLKWIQRKVAGFKKRAESPAPEQVQKLDSWQAIDLSKIHPVNRDEVQRIIAKAEAGGLDALSPDEARFLSNFIGA